MNNYLIADYILGYSLSNNSFFSAKDIAMELSMPVAGITLIFTELCRLNRDWFEVIPGSQASEMKIARKREYDDAIIEWLIEGESKKHFNELGVIRSSYYPVKKNIVKREASPFKSTMRVIVFISTRQVLKDRDWALKNIIHLKKVIQMFRKKGL